jgi:hypothetical protein
MLAHEMIMDPDFQLKPEESTKSMEVQVKAITKESILWRDARKGLS